MKEEGPFSLVLTFVLQNTAILGFCFMEASHIHVTNIFQLVWLGNKLAQYL